ncbi:UDP-sugar hydrolase / 5'-nucleotidase [Halorubrum kocurii JCM 14978]|uniref:UDP-sugar hydrolase / 5'-nucleotidase n=1 Tax=Halorubrum kocurii JCM 14978 TaxID=1230456 RepID=M0NGS2_9EURY|nr:UDP-sugar hydrolase / 5'-nucleotidase [Halorubrum kocurii JCM 14978]
MYEDVNGDGSVNALDVQALFANLNSDSVQGNMAFDFNGDGSVSVIDVQYMFAQL